MKNHQFFKKNAIVAFLISTAVLFSLSCSKQPIELSPGNNTSSTGKVSNNFSENHNYIPDVNNDFQAKAVSYYDKIENAFSSTPGRIRNETSDYPGYYGGAYINPQGKLVVLIKGDVSKEKKNIAKIIGSDDFITLPCKHSYKSLVKIMKDLNEFCLNKANDSKTKNTNAYGLTAGLNQITVELADFSDKKIRNLSVM
jgi:streptogrisin B